MAEEATSDGGFSVSDVGEKPTAKAAKADPRALKPDSVMPVSGAAASSAPTTATPEWHKMTPEEQKAKGLSPGSSALIEITGPRKAPSAPVKVGSPDAGGFVASDVGERPLPPAARSALHPKVEQHVRQQAVAKGVDPSWVIPLYMAEGGGLDKVSPAGAMGPSQLMPGTAAAEGVNPHILSQNVEGGVNYLKEQLNTFGGNYLVAAAAYNAGPANPGVQEFAKTGNPSGLPNETKAYINKILHLRQQQLMAETQGGEISANRWEPPAEPHPAPALKAFAQKAIGPSIEPINTLKAGSQALPWDTPEQDRDIDYRSGAPFMMRVMLETASNPKEARLELGKFFAPSDFGQDFKGRWWGKIDGKRVAIMPTTNLWGRLESFAAAATAWAPQNLGEYGGFAMGARFGAAAGLAGGPIGVATGAALGGLAGWMVGYESSEAMKALRGTYDKTPGEALGSAGEQLAIGAVGEALPAGGRAVKNWLRTGYAGVTPTITNLTNKIMAMGGLPSAVSFGPKMYITQYKQMLLRKIFGDPTVDKNYRVVRDQIRNVFKAMGFTQDQMDDIEIAATTGQTAGTADVGQHIVGAARAWQQDLASDVAKHVNDAKRVVEQNLGAIQRWGSTATSRLGEDVAKSFVVARKRFATSMNSAMDALNDLSGSYPIVPLHAVVAKARELVGVLPKNSVPGLIQALAERLPMNMTVSFKEAHELRNDLRTILDLFRVNPGSPSHKVAEMVAELDRSFDYMADVAYTNYPQLQAIAQQLRDGLKQFNKAYRDGIKPFNNALVNRMVKDYEVDGIVPDAGRVAESIFTDGMTEQTRAILKLLPQPVKDEVAKYQIINVFKAALVPHPTTGAAVLSGKELNKVLDADTMKQLRELYTTQFVADLKRHAEELAVVQNFEKGIKGNVEGYLDDIAHLSPGAILNELAQARQKQIMLLSYVRDNPLAALLSNKQGNVFDTAVQYITQPGHEAITQAARHLLMQYSPETWQNVQKQSLLRVMSGALRMDHIGHIDVDAKALEDSVKAFTPGQQAMLFPGEALSEMHDLVEMTKFLWPERVSKSKGLKFAGGLAAATILGHVGLGLSHATLAADAVWLTYGFWHMALYSRNFPVRWVVNMSKVDPAKATRVTQVILDAMIDNAFSGPGHETPEDQDRERQGVPKNLPATLERLQHLEPSETMH